MELSFIWVKKFNSLVNFSLNLSNKYQYKYDSDTNFLSRSNDSPLPKDFFGKGVTSVTGIFGKNGSGKTNCLKLIGSIMSRARSRIDSDFIAVIDDVDGPVVYFRFKEKDRLDPTIDFSGTIKNYGDDIRGLNTVFLSNTFDSVDMGFDKKIMNLSIANRGKSKDEFIDIIEFLTDKELGGDFPKPSEVEVVLKPLRSKNFNSILLRLEPSLIYNLNSELSDINDLSKKFIDRINVRLRKKSKIYDVILVIAINETINIFRSLCQRSNNEEEVFNYLNMLLNYFKFDKPSVGSSIDQLQELSFYIENARVSVSSLDNTIERDATEYYKDKISKLIDSLESISTLLEVMEYSVFKVDDISYSSVDGFKFVLGNDNYSEDYLDSLSLLSNYGRLSFRDMSSGQKAILGILASIYSQVKRKRNATLIMLDEADLYLHPEWQLFFVKKMTEILSSLNKSSVQLIITSHSPLIMTDFPKRCLILLENRNKETFIKKNSFNPFGANLYELYSQGFFLKESKVGALAFEKITSLINEIKYNTTGSPLHEDFYLTLDLISDEVSKAEIMRLTKKHDKDI
ncbi:AAA family ATPase [Photobacterium leiognathi]|uniref:AAA family ATPase n=1 Tax=Photobacterium leiognathi TaxID=553611 RepID=UPI002982A62A|nr:AAA family ATPase [Photobacterium leiognathi]